MNQLIHYSNTFTKSKLKVSEAWQKSNLLTFSCTTRNKYIPKQHHQKKNLTEESGKYCCDTISISCIVLSVSWTFKEISAASFFRVSRVVMTESSSRIWPLESFRTCNRFFSSCRNLNWNSPKKVKEEYEY